MGKGGCRVDGGRYASETSFVSPSNAKGTATAARDVAPLTQTATRLLLLATSAHRPHATPSPIIFTLQPFLTRPASEIRSL